MTWILMTFYFGDAITDAKAALEAAKLKPVVPVIETELPGKPEVAAPVFTWSDVVSSAPDADILYVVSGPNCAPCAVLKSNLEALGIPFEPLTVEEHKAKYGWGPASIPYSFVFNREKENSRYVLNGMKTQAELTAWTAHFKLAPPAAQSVQCSVTGEFTLDAVAEALVTHLARQKNVSSPIVGGVFDIKVPLSDRVRELLIKGAYSKRLDLKTDTVWLTWDSLGFTIKDGDFTFSSPVRLHGSFFGVSITAALTKLHLSEDGRTLDVAIDGFPDLRVVFTGATNG